MLNLGRIVLSLCLGAQIVSVDAIAKDESPPTLARRRPQLICTLQAGRPKEGDCWKAFEDIPKNDPMRYIFGPGDKAVTFETPKFFLYG